MRRRLLILLCAALVSVACGFDERPSDPLSKVLLQEVPGDYDLVEGPSSGPMDLAAASRSLFADEKDKRELLESNDFRRGYSRVWTRGREFISVLVYQLRDEEGAKAVMLYEFQELGERKTAALFPVPEIPGAVGFTVSGVPGRDSKNVDCRGVWFDRANKVFSVLVCGPNPPTEETFTDVARRQFLLAQETTPLGGTSPAPPSATE